MWPTTATVGPPPVPATLATVEPTESYSICAPNAAAASRKTAAGACSYPDGPGALSSLRSVSGSGMKPGRLLRQKLAQHVRQDAAVFEVLDLLRGVDAHARRELLVARANIDLLRLASLQARDRELLLAGQA